LLRHFEEERESYFVGILIFSIILVAPMIEAVDPNRKGLYRAGGLSMLAVGILYIISTGLFIMLGYMPGTDSLYSYASPSGSSKITTSLTCTLSPSSIYIGDSVSITGSITPAFSDAHIYIHVQGSGVSYDLNATSQNGLYNLSLTLTKAGTYSFQAFFYGDADHSESQSDIVSLDVKKISTTLTLTASYSTIFVNILRGTSSEIDLSGRLASNKGGVSLVPIRITITEPSGKVTYTLTTFENGDFTMAYGRLNYTEAGICTIIASFAGNDQYEASSSSQVLVTVQISFNSLMPILMMIVVIFTFFFMLWKWLRRSSLP
jgi:hypothetical protein